MKISVVIPAYNEQDTIVDIITEIDSIFKKLYDDYEIIVVNDKSIDNTLNITEELSKKIKTLKIISNEKNLGKTKTVIKAFNTINTDILSFIDADYQYNPKDLPSIIQKVIDGYDICSGNRKNRMDSIYRKIASRSFNLFNRLVFNIQLDDVNCGLKAMRKDIFNKITIDYLNARWFIDTELLAKATHSNFKITQIDIDHSHRKKGSSKVNIMKLAVETIAYAILLKYKLLTKK